ncbi:hypothetical protein EI555_001821 [Monodon monoceros]|uniref:Uncharacterized protein n=1 Tax=Monodon monoceros TaxID=40151 RepID=A0A4U1F5P9_MONMO|nr:hypothetical protein EI555_001821 [Monodon monoceros]
MAAHGGKMVVQISKERKFVTDNIFKAELNGFLTQELAEDGYYGVLSYNSHDRNLTAVVQKRSSFPEGSVELYTEKVATRGLCAIAQAESLYYRFLGGLAVWRRACCDMLPFIMECGAKACIVMVLGNSEDIALNP